MSATSTSRGTGRPVPPALPTGERLRVDWPSCHAHGLCAELLPELIHLDEWGYPVLADGGRVPYELSELAKQAAAACPTLALRRVSG